MTWEVLTGDCLEVMPTLEPNSVDSIVTDPPYGLSQGPAGYLGEKKGRGFMGKNWDHGVPGPQFWREALRVAKPGAHLLAFGGDRTHHRQMTAIEDAGWELRTCIYWVFSSGFPKSHQFARYMNENAEPWRGWGTALKPAVEIIVMARKPLDGTVAQNVLKWGTGGINVDGCRVPGNGEVMRRTNNVTIGGNGIYQGGKAYVTGEVDGRRWPANLIHDGSDEVVELFPMTNGKGHTPRKRSSGGISTRGHAGQDQVVEPWHDSGSAARFFYCAKASKRDRDEGLEGMAARQYSHDGRTTPIENPYQRNDSIARNHHPTVKPTALLRYLCRLVTPPGGIVLDPFAGSGSTGKAAMLEGFRFIGIEKEEEYAEIARARIAHAAGQARQLEML